MKSIEANNIISAIDQGADPLSTHPRERWSFTPLHKAAYAGKAELVQLLLDVLRKRKILQENLRTRAHPRGRGEYGFPAELARGAPEVAALLRSAFRERNAPQMMTLMLCIARHNAEATGALFSVTGLLYRERRLLHMIRHWMACDFAIGDVVRVEQHGGWVSGGLYGSVGRAACGFYEVVCRPLHGEPHMLRVRESQLQPGRFDPELYKHQLQSDWTTRYREQNRDKHHGWLSKEEEKVVLVRQWLVTGLVAICVGVILAVVMAVVLPNALDYDCPFSQAAYANMSAFERGCTDCKVNGMNRFVVHGKYCNCKTCMCNQLGECVDTCKDTVHRRQGWC